MSVSRKYILTWLIAGCVLIYCMVLIGGITRLTGSGLSIPEWDLVFGAVPPANEAEWQAAFEKYRATPQYLEVNYDYTLQDFKAIYFWEYVHRLLGRVIGLVFIVPFIFFLLKGWLNRKRILQCLGIFVLGGIQGLLGWLMVKSGLVDDPRVSHYRLAAHLITAFASFGFTFLVALDVYFEGRKDYSVAQEIPPAFRSSVNVFLILVVIQIIYGAFVAGLWAGRIYNTYPLMDGEFMPAAVIAMDPFWKNLTENLAGVQFIHRLLALLLLVGGIYIYGRSRNGFPARVRDASTLVVLILFAQFTLGIITLLLAVPIELGLLHQSFAFLLFASVIYLIFQINLQTLLLKKSA